jgi:hypothetical protein
MRAAVDIDGGKNNELSVMVRTEVDELFVKGLRSAHPRVFTQAREAAINPHLVGISPLLLFHVQVDGWDVLVFEHLSGRHADVTPGSADLPAVATLLERLAGLPPPGLRLVRVEHRWAEHARTEDLALLAGGTIAHTDMRPENIIVSDGRAWLVDWAWAAQGAPFIDVGPAVLWLIARGHSAEQAQAWAGTVEGWRAASPASVAVLARVHARVWAEIAATDSQPWKTAMADGARRWCDYQVGA